MAIFDINRLPPTYPQGRLNLCAISAFATATYPFCQCTRDDLLLDFWQLYNSGNAIPDSDALKHHYNQEAESCFELFKYKHGKQFQMLHWFDFLGTLAGARHFNKIRSNCELQFDPTISEFSIRLQNEVTVGCIGIAVHCEETNHDLAHYVNVWFDGHKFCLRDSRCSGSNPVDGTADSVEDIVSTCSLLTQYRMTHWWRVLVAAKTTQNTTM